MRHRRSRRTGALGGILGTLVVLISALACLRLPHSTRDEAAIAVQETAPV